MTLKQAAKLAVGDIFRKPSTNGHDDGFRYYEVQRVTTKGLLTEYAVVEVLDQYGYSSTIAVAPYNAEWFRDAVKNAGSGDPAEARAIAEAIRG